jgi:hypothetical protein
MVKSQVPSWSAEGTELATQTLTETLQPVSIIIPHKNEAINPSAHITQSPEMAPSTCSRFIVSYRAVEAQPGVFSHAHVRH